MGIVAINSSRIDDGWTRVTGEVVDSTSRINDGSTTYSPIIKYDVDGRTYQATGTIGTSSRPAIGAQKEVAYNPAQPDQAKVVESGALRWLLYLFPLIGIASLIIAPFLFIRSLRRGGKIKNLMQSGQKLQGVLVDVQTGGSSRNGNYKIVVSAVDGSGAVQNYISDPLAGIGGLAMADFRNTPIPIDVYIDPANPQNYYVDIADIPNLTPERIGELIKSAASAQQPGTFVAGDSPATALPGDSVNPPSDQK